MSTNPDWLDRSLGGFCKNLKEQIEELPLLNWKQKEEFIQMLDDCASKADASPGDSVAFMRRELLLMRQEIRAKTGKDLAIG